MISHVLDYEMLSVFFLNLKHYIYIYIYRLSIIWKSDITDEMKAQFLPGSGCIDTAIWMHYMDAKLNGWRRNLTATTQEC